MNPQLQIMLQQGIQAFQNGNFDGADSILRRIIQVDSKNLPALHILGLIKTSQNKYQEAVDLLGRAARLNPNDASIQYNLAKALMDCGSDKESIPHHKKAVEINPKNPDAWLNYGKALSALHSYEEALIVYDKVLLLVPNYAEAYLNAGATLTELKRYDQALVFTEKALELNPSLAEAWVNKGVTLKKLKRFEEAVTHFEKALALKPGIEWIYGDALHLKMKLSSWDGLANTLDSLSSWMCSQEKIMQPFVSLAVSDDAMLHRHCAEKYVEDKFKPNSSLGVIAKRQEKVKIRIGYYSADFYNHATGYLMAELFELHDKERFELIGFSFGPKEDDEIRRRLVNSFDQFLEVSTKSDIEIAQLSRNLSIDIAIDLKGYTEDSRPGIFSYRAAPIQVNYLGYPGTMGADFMDYIIADETIIPSEMFHNYSEKVVQLPNSYQVNDRKRAISDRKFTRQELGLPDAGFVFCCFNNNYKILPNTFDGWMRILKEVDDSVLWLFEDNPAAAANLKNEAARRGVNSQRLVFCKRMPLAEHLARQNHANLFLDTFPYNAHTTASDALWAELPVLTLMGQTFASRVAASLLNAIHLPELITTTQAEYEQLAIYLAKNPLKLEAIRQKLRDSRLTAPLFDTPLFTKNLENTYAQMYECYQASLGYKF